MTALQLCAKTSRYVISRTRRSRLPVEVSDNAGAGRHRLYTGRQGKINVFYSMRTESVYMNIGILA